MRLIAAFFKMIRLPNLLFIALTQVLFYECIIRTVLDPLMIAPAIGRVPLLIVILSSVFIAAAGYIINDYFDINIDQVNKPRKNVIDKLIHRRWAIAWHFMLNSAGLLFT